MRQAIFDVAVAVVCVVMIWVGLKGLEAIQ